MDGRSFENICSLMVCPLLLYLSERATIYAPFFWEGSSPWLPRANRYRRSTSNKELYKVQNHCFQATCRICFSFGPLLLVPCFSSSRRQSPFINKSLFHVEQGSESLASLSSVCPFLCNYRFRLQKFLWWPGRSRGTTINDNGWGGGGWGASISQ
jgi:hypothetical protein